MNERSVFHLIFDITQEHKIPCVLIGGFAVNHYQVSRQTADVDFLITEDDYKKIEGLLEKAGYKRAVLHDNFAQLESGQLSLMDVDFVFVEQGTLEKVLAEGQKIKIAGQTFIVPSLFHLIALKLHAIKNNKKIRLTKDFPDIVNLIRINKIDIKDKKFEELCLKFGTKEIYDLIMEAV